MSAEGQESPSSKWRENHGNFLLGFVALVLVIGAGLVIYRQNSAHSSTSPPNVAPRPTVISVGGGAPDADPDQLPPADDPAGAADADPAADSTPAADDTPATDDTPAGGAAKESAEAESAEAESSADASDSATN